MFQTNKFSSSEGYICTRSMHYFNMYIKNVKETLIDTLTSYLVSAAGSYVHVHMVLFLFDNVIYVFLFLLLCILILCLCMTKLTEVFQCLFPQL
jgi:VIT1/CCC1 family predicted Fe2+/Mn2+ transporter